MTEYLHYVQHTHPLTHAKWSAAHNPRESYPAQLQLRTKEKSHSRYRVKGKLHKMPLCQGNKKKKTSVVSIFFTTVSYESGCGLECCAILVTRKVKLVNNSNTLSQNTKKKKTGMNVPLNAVSQDLETARTLRANLNFAAVPLRAYHGPLANCYDRLLFGPLYS